MRTPRGFRPGAAAGVASGWEFFKSGDSSLSRAEINEPKNGHMTAAVLYGSENLKIESIDIPRLAADEALIRFKVALTCGTDLKVWKRGYHARMIVPPAVFGHELAGVVETLGSDVNGGLGGRAGGSLEFSALQCLPVLPQGAEQSLRGPAVQQRRLRRVHPHSGSHRAA